MMRSDLFSRERCIEKLIASEKIPRDKLDECLRVAKETRQSVFYVLMERDVLPEAQALSFLSEQTGVPILNLASLRIPGTLINMVPKKLVEKYHILPVGRIGNAISVVTSDPFEIMAVDELRDLTKCSVQLVLGSPKLISAAVESYYGDASNMEDVLGGIDDDELEVVRATEGEEGGPEVRTGSSVDDAPVVKMVKLIIEEAVRMRASDIHFEPYERAFRVRYRIDGALRESFSHARDLYGALVARVKIISNLDITEKRLPQDGRFRIRLPSKEIDFRVSVLPIYHGEKMVLRVLDKGGVKSGLGNLGFSEKPTQAFAEAVKNPYGMILVTGPTGSGKSTTLYTILGTLNTPERNIMTIEDPVEYQVEGITQTQVHTEVGMTFAGGLRALLRQSPDVILIGEMRDTETADIGVKAALTGHLVFSTLHTNSAAGAMTRLIDMGVEPFLIANSVICVAAQRLVKKVCEFCKSEEKLSEALIRRCGLPAEKFHGVTAYRGRGCAKCNKTGYYGRQGVIEVLKVDSEIRNMIIQRKASDEIERKAIANGMETLFENAFGLLVRGTTTLDEVLRVTARE